MTATSSTPSVPDSKPLTDAKRRKLCFMMSAAFVEIRSLGWDGKVEQPRDLADAFHNLPICMWRDDFSLPWLRDRLVEYQLKYPKLWIYDFVAMVDGIIGMKD